MNANAKIDQGKRPSEIYSEGLQAHANGMKTDANPYRAGSQESSAWDQGWRSDVAPQDCAPEDIPPVSAPSG
jgi:ribosome modulation factor